MGGETCLVFSVQGMLLYLVVSTVSGDTSGKAFSGSSGIVTSTTESPSPSTQNGCFPNVINTTVPSNKLKKVGTFYEYRSKSDDTVYNAFYTVTLVGNGLIYLPATLTPGVHSIQKFQQVVAKNGTNTCNYQNIDVVSDFSGVDFFLDFDSNADNVPLNQVSYYLYDEDGPNGFEIAYICDVPNFQTGVCDAIELYVNTRANPNQMTVDQKSAIDAIIDRTLQPYCLSHSDLFETIFRNDVQQCNEAPTQAFSSLVQAFASSLPARLA
ncbi:hypothetical protein RvY_16823 [Ramazzottius varieornatus]|uniref:Uncharacterized protein n=1 Tax=Ramazzottius varieornatus TaxID=947166 RepID=A0A1D1W650_RAMVA|nr:hypothetical protein RvY_16823 [Ramazzottius varieornatus]